MAVNGKSVGMALVKALLMRAIFITLPVNWISRNLPSTLKIDPNVSTMNQAAIGIIAAALAILAIVALFRPKILIKPICGLALLWSVNYLLKDFPYHGLGEKPLRFFILASAYAACAYLIIYDTAVFFRELYARLHRRFSPSATPNWAGDFANTNEKGEALEAYVCQLYKKMYGNAITTTEMKRQGLIPNGPGDQGADVIVKLPNGKRLAIQCKNYGSPMGNSAVQEIITAKAYYNADELAIVSPSGFTSRCIELAQSQSRYYGVRIDLIDGMRLDEFARATKLSVA